MREEIELMRVIRVPPMGKLVIEIGTNRYENISEINDERLKRRVITAIGELMGLAGGYQALVDEGVAPPLSAQTPSGSLQKKAAALKEQQERFLETLEKEKDALARQTKGAMPETAVSTPTITNEPAKPSSLVDQIDNVLQKHVQATEQLRNRDIHLIQGPDGNIKIKVDGKVFDRPKDIEEKLIQLTIKQALKEWESR